MGRATADFFLAPPPEALGEGSNMPQGVKLGDAGGSKTLAWGFAMAPHRMRILVFRLYLNFNRTIYEG